jgi:hypothetical protein
MGAGGTAGTTGAGTAGMGGGGAGGTGGMRPMGTGIDGSNCSSGSDCMSSWCVDTVCCATECTGACMTCKGGTPGVCVPADSGSNARGACAMESPASCGTTGVCDGAGACRYHPAGQVCSTTLACDDTSSAVVTKFVCNGSGACVPNMSQSCSPYACASATCRTTCTADTDCAPSSFCSSSVCYPSGSVNIAGNGDLETGTLTGWSPANGGGAISLSSVASSGVANGGAYSIVGTNRTMSYHGPAYALPTGPGKYIITAWGFQRDLASMPGALQVRLSCLNSTGYYLPVQYDLAMPQNMWTLFSATVDTTQGVGTDCLPTGATPGLVRSAYLYLNHLDTVSAPYPPIYLDDVVVQVTDGHNLVGNPNFESGVADGWSLSAGSSSVAIDTTAAHLGTKSMHQSGRSIPSAGPRYLLPIGTARYDISFWVRHAPAPTNPGDLQTHDLMLQTTYSCINPPGAMSPTAPIAMVTGVAKNTWVELKGTATFPPADAPAGCKLSLAAVYVRHEGTACSGPCPELFIDDVSITLAK